MHRKTTVICEVRNSTHYKTILVVTHCCNYLENCKTYCESKLTVKCVLHLCFQLAHHGGSWALGNIRGSRGLAGKSRNPPYAQKEDAILFTCTG
jgi:hypothetical protein